MKRRWGRERRGGIRGRKEKREAEWGAERREGERIIEKEGEKRVKKMYCLVPKLKIIIIIIIINNNNNNNNNNK